MLQTQKLASQIINFSTVFYQCMDLNRKKPCILQSCFTQGPENLILAIGHHALLVPSEQPSLPNSSADDKGEACLPFLLIYFLVAFHKICIFDAIKSFSFMTNIIQTEKFLDHAGRLCIGM